MDLFCYSSLKFYMCYSIFQFCSVIDLIDRVTFFVVLAPKIILNVDQMAKIGTTVQIHCNSFVKYAGSKPPILNIKWFKTGSKTTEISSSRYRNVVKDLPGNFRVISSVVNVKVLPEKIYNCEVTVNRRDSYSRKTRKNITLKTGITFDSF